MLSPTRVRLLGEEGDITSAAQWNDPARAKLWLYNLHYFDDLSADRHEERDGWHRKLIARWVVENPPAQGNGWEPYPISLRIVNWIKWALGGAPLEPRAAESLALQARWLKRRLEWHLLGNHLLANAKALVFAGLYFEGPEAESWLALGLRILDKQIAEQILADGGHFERSTMYHAIVLEDVLDLINLFRAYEPPHDRQTSNWRDCAWNMRHWLRAMTLGDRRIAFFNDAAFGVCAEPAELESYAERLGLLSLEPAEGMLVRLQASGYNRLSLNDAVVITDVAPIGPDYLPGHAHADTLSFECSLGRDRVIVNGGTSRYGTGAERLFERSTAAHSTVEIDGQSSSEIWGGFRVGRRARVHDLNSEVCGGAIQVSASHDGYRYQRGRPIHRRHWILSTGRLVVRDFVTAQAANAVARFHLGPGVTARINADCRSGTLDLPSKRSMTWSTSMPAIVAGSSWHPEFGRSVATQQIVVPLDERPLETTFDW